MAEAKICGIKTVEALDAAVSNGARFVGLVFFPNSSRHISLEAAAALAARARGRADIVAVTVDADDAMLGDIARAVAPDWIQAHGSENPQRTASLKRFAGNGVIKALGIGGAHDFGLAAAYGPAADMLLFDAKPPPGAALPGGNATAFDWPILFGRRFSRPWLLSGGLNSDNVADAIACSGAGLVDVSSGVETEPGLKDPVKIAAFLASVRAT